MKRLIVATALILFSHTGGAMQADIQEWTTRAGTEVLFVERHELPIVDVRVTFDAGSARDGDTPGLARMTSNLLLEGTPERSAGGIARGFERYGARVSTGSGRDTAQVSVRALSEPARLDPVIDSLADVIAKADFPADAVERVRRQMSLGLQQAQSSASALAEKAFMRGIYGEHPYATPPGGTLESVEALTRAAVVDFHRRHYTARNATIAIVGDLSAERARAIANALSGALPAGEALAALPPVDIPSSAQTIRVPLEAEQTHVMMGQPSVRKGSEAYYALYLGNHILGGGGLTSILAERMREERGLSYSSASSLTSAARRGRFQMTTQVRNDSLPEALSVMRDSLEEMRVDEPAAQRLSDSKRNITGSFPLQLDSNRDLLGYIATIGFYGLSRDYLEAFVERIDGLDGEAVRAAMHEHIDPARNVTVLVGPEATINAAE
ncbi:insulinase family protein [Spiribacter aquaticus]|uniref:Insulinase family protein n=1 Tax=Spiribacter aquaticus TaxID=1935996 RepID=A0A557RN37_9GAMM|nr:MULTISPECIES: pitrilysin family protein [Spiribacter]KAF0279556.1 peptidase M16 [Spiribacter roseus]TVO66518.1 insulinase family protein [Spiribacter aquaticus]